MMLLFDTCIMYTHPLQEHNMYSTYNFVLDAQLVGKDITAKSEHCTTDVKGVYRMVHVKDLYGVEYYSILLGSCIVVAFSLLFPKQNRS